MFYSPIAWIVLIIFAVQAAIEGMSDFSSYVRFKELGYDTGALTNSIFAGLNGFFLRIQRTAYLYIPMITMGLMSKEFSSGSIKLLYSSPISNFQVIVGKYLSAVFFCLMMVLILLMVSAFGFVAIEQVDFGQVLTGLLGIFMVLIAYAAIGLFWSSLTSYQIVALIGALATAFILQRLGRVGQDIDLVRDITYWLSIGGRSDTFIYGMITSEDLLYFLLIAGLFITYSILRLKGIREKSSKVVMAGSYVIVFLVAAGIGYLSTVPGLKAYYDATRAKRNTLTEKSQEVMQNMSGEIKITTYTNPFGWHAGTGVPRAQKRAEQFFERYYRFYPKMKFDFKYYHALPGTEEHLNSHKVRYKGLSYEASLDKVLNIYSMDGDDVFPAADYANEIDLESELYRLVRKIETEDGKVVHLRMFDDLQRVPFESQITAAFKRLNQELPLVGFVTGHQERGIDNIGTRGYHTIAKEKPFRWSLINNGVNFDNVDLSKPVDEKITILVVAEAKQTFTASEMANLNAYIERGGNLVIAADTKRQKAMNPLVEQFGVTYLPGQAVEYNKGFTMDLVTSEITEQGKELAHQFQNIVDEVNSSRGRGVGVITMPGALAMTYQRKDGFNYTPLLQADEISNVAEYTGESSVEALKSEYADTTGVVKERFYRNRYDEDAAKGKYKGSWNEMQTTDFIDDIPFYQPETGETGGPITTGLAITRQVGDKEQKILVLGDADCFSNGEIATQRKNINNQNANFIAGMFFWLTDEVSPTDVRRPEDLDVNMKVVKDDLFPYNILYKWVIPALLIASLLIIWLRRRGR